MSVRLRTLVSATLVASALATVPLLATPAQAAVTTGPTAVAISSSGTTYAGTAAGGSLTRIDATGAVIAPLTLPRSGPVDGLAFAPDGDLWVSYGYGASRIDPSSGAEEVFVDGSAPAITSCPASDADDPGVYGGIVAPSNTEVVIAHRCGSYTGLNIYRLSSGTWQAMGGATPVFGGRWGDIAFGPRSDGQSGNAYYLAVPDQAKVEVRGGFDNVHETPIRTIDVQAHGGGVTPRPVGVAVDDQGQVFVADAANHVIYVYNNGGTQYDRYIGNPPDPDTWLGGFDGITSIAQYPRNGSISEFQGNLFVADGDNNRVQRVNPYGYAFWAAPTDGTPSTPGSPPNNQTLPSVSGTPSVGSTLTCNPGEWAGAPTTYLYGWNRDGSYIPSASGQSTYTPVSSDGGHKISCYVQAQNAAGTSGYATSAGVTISSTPPPLSAPVNTIAPTVSGTPQPGATLSCANGSWTGNPIPTYTRQWYRDNVPIAGATDSAYTVVDDDLGTTLICRVTADNGQGGPVAKNSAGITVTATTPPSGCGGVANTVSIDGGSVYTTTASVTLTIRPPVGATQVLISNDGGFDSAAVRSLSATCTYPWALATGGGTATKSVYVRFAGGGHSEATVGPADDIVLDGAAPAVTVPRIQALAKQGPRSKVFRVSLKASDRTSGVASVQYAAQRGAKGTTVRYRGSFTTRTPKRFQWVRVHDKAGNVSAWKKVVRLKAKRR